MTTEMNGNSQGRVGSRPGRAARIPALGVVLLLAVGALSPRDAQACGGFFCDSANAVNQSAERIVFAQDGQGNVTQIVEVLYQGQAEKFAWVLPVPGKPTPSVGSTQVLDRIQQATNPRYQLNYSFESCSDDFDASFSGSASGGASSGAIGIDAGEAPAVIVLDSGSVGKFDYDTISVNPDLPKAADVAVEWLTDNGYDVGELGAQVLEPYLANGLNLIAFKLQKGASTGAIRPIILQYQAAGMAIPIRPTAVATVPDMPILVWVLGEERAVPTNYYGLELNELLINWFSPSASYNAAVNAAADEAGGQGFVTEYAQLSGAGIVGYAADDFRFHQALLRQDGEMLMTLTNVFGSYDGYVDAVRDHLNLRAGVTPELFVSNAYCYFHPQWCGDYSTAIDENDWIAKVDPIYSSDLAAFQDSVRDNVLGPIGAAEKLVERLPYITRLYTTMSASDMTLDPAFDFNPDLPQVSNLHNRDIYVYCDDSWTMTMADGTRVYGEQNGVWPISNADGEMPFNARIVSYDTSGEATVDLDNTALIASLFAAGTAAEPPSDTVAYAQEYGLSNADDGQARGCTIGRIGAGQPTSWSFWLGGASVLGLLSLMRSRRLPRAKG